MKIGALILAAGYSSRMGDFKPLMRISGKSLLANGVHRFKKAGISDIFLVTGHRADDLQAEARSLGVKLVYNENHDQGMFSSVVKGIKKMRQYDGFFLLPVDIPLFHRATLTTLLGEFTGKVTLIPTYKGEQGHPPLIPGTLCEKIAAHNGQKGLRGILMKLPFHEIKVWDRGILLDADTPEAFNQLKSRFVNVESSELEKEEAEELASLMMTPALISHCKAVAVLALAFAQRLDNKSSAINTELLYNGALLHDVAKGVDGHEHAGKVMMQGFGLEKIAEIIGNHRSTPVPQDDMVTEKELVCLADKFIKGTAKFSMEDRFNEKLERYRDDQPALAAIKTRYEESTALFGFVEKKLGSSLAELVEQVDIA